MGTEYFRTSVRVRKYVNSNDAPLALKGKTTTGGPASSASLVGAGTDVTERLCAFATVQIHTVLRHQTVLDIEQRDAHTVSLRR